MKRKRRNVPERKRTGKRTNETEMRLLCEKTDTGKGEGKVREFY